MTEFFVGTRKSKKSVLRKKAKKILGPVVIGMTRNNAHNALSRLRKVKQGGGKDDPLLLYQEQYPDTFRFSSYTRGGNFYGLDCSLRKFAGRRTPVKASMEHGLYVGPYVNAGEASESGFPCVLTFGPTRANHIGNSFDTPVLQVGPYIHYSQCLFGPKVIRNLKEEQGKTLVVFPTHSIEGYDVAFDHEDFFRKVSQLERDFGIATTIYCLYFNDVNKGLGKLYRECGKRVACAGHRSDPLFLSRLRAIIELSDVTASNGVGTHIGYCEALGKPHYLFDMPVQREEEPEVQDCLARGDGLATQEAELEEIKAAFAIDGRRDNRGDVLMRYWGLDKLRSREYLSMAFAGFDDAYRLMRLHGLTQREAVEETVPFILS